MIKQYKINKHNSTVCGYPGRDFDWSKFDWEGKSIYIPSHKRVKNWGAPKPWVDNGFIAPNCEYLHVSYDFAEHGTIYRVRPNDSMYAGETYRGHLVRSQKAIKKDDGWYWELDLAEIER